VSVNELIPRQAVV